MSETFTTRGGGGIPDELTTVPVDEINPKFADSAFGYTNEYILIETACPTT